MAHNDQAFFKALGARIAHLRKQHELTQTELGARVGIAQQTLGHYEAGRLRVPASLLPELAEIFGVTVDALIGGKATAPGKRGPSPKLQQQLERLRHLPKSKQRLVSEILDSVLSKAG